MTDKLHSRFDVADGIHIVHSWVVADNAARDALVVAPEDIGRIAFVAATQQFHILVADSGDMGSVWLRLGAVEPGDEALAVSTASTGGSSTTYSRSDHTHEGASREFAINAQTGVTTYTFSATDDLVALTNGAAITATVPPNSTVPIPIGRTITVVQGGAGQVTIAPGAGVTLKPSLTLKTRAIDCPLTLVKVAIDTWRVWGDAAVI